MRGRETDQRKKKEPEPSPPPCLTLIRHQDEFLGTQKPVSFTVKETVCPRTTQQSPEQCDFKENGVRLGFGVNVSQGAEQGASGKVSCPWGDAGRLWPRGFQFDLEPLLPAGETVCGESHPGPVQ